MNPALRRIEFLLLVLAAAALFVDPIAFPRHALHPDHGRVTDLQGNFVVDAVYPTTDQSNLPPHAVAWGSWTGSDAFTGDCATGWFLAERHLVVYVSGYPDLPGNHLELVVQDESGRENVVPYPHSNPAEKWAEWNVNLPFRARRVRIRAADHRTQLDGWLGFTVPYRAIPGWSGGLNFLKLGLTCALAWSVLCAPGLLWVSRKPGRSLALGILVGPLFLAVAGAVIWTADGAIPAVLLGRIIVGALLIFLLVVRLRSGCPWISASLRVPIAGAALLAGFAVAKANLSLGPPGELYGGTISRTLEVGWHSDSRVPYHVVQVAAHHWGINSPSTASLFFPYAFCSRGPSSGLIATPVMLASGAVPATGFPGAAWVPFDSEGFVTCRIVWIFLSSLAAWAVWGVAEMIGGRACALIALNLLLLTPFFTHELFFTWPKQYSAALVLTSFALIQERKYAAAGFALGWGYWFHPAVLLSAPFLAFWILFNRTAGTVPRRIAVTALLTLSTVAMVAPWAALSRLPHSGVGQEGFLSYLTNADSAPATWHTWLASRWQNVATTFIPGFAAVFRSHDYTFNSVAGPSGGWVHYSLLYWVSLPFALGLPTFGVALVAITRLTRRSPLIAIGTVLGPAIWLCAYWGSVTTGLMRQCGHVFFLTVILVTAWQMPWPKLCGRPWFAWLRAADLLVMAFGSTLAVGWPVPSSPYFTNDLCSLAIAGLCVAGTVGLVLREGEGQVS